MDRATYQQPPVRESISLLYELDLGRHFLLILSDGSIDLVANEELTPALAETGLHLDNDETYRLFISLHEQFKQQEEEIRSELGSSTVLDAGSL